jgi:uncharacterized delta-60 repeat protein
MNNLQIRYGRLGLSIILGLTFTLIAITTIHAEGPGDLDKTFNRSGVITTPVGSVDVSGTGYGIAIQPDGKIVAVGIAQNSSTYSSGFAVVRYTITGSLDLTFKDTGIVTTPFGDSGLAYSVAIQPDGKIVAAGYSRDVFGEPFNFTVARYTISGDLDSTFNDSGIVTTPITNADGYGRGVALQSDGKIVVAGRSEYNSGDNDFAVVRYTPTGTLDSTFNDTGIVTTPIGSGEDRGFGVELQSDGKIVVAGFSENGNGNTGFAVVRYTTTGTLDSTFNDTGIVTTPIGNFGDVAFPVAIQPDDKIVVAGAADDSFAVVRYTVSGSLDSTFNQGGIVTTTVSDNQEGDGLALQSDGKIVVTGGSCNSSSYCTFTVLRYRDDGILDTTFNHTGVVTTPIGNAPFGAWAFSTVIQPDDKILVVGVSDGNFAVVRYLGRGNIYLPLVLKD